MAKPTHSKRPDAPADSRSTVEASRSQPPGHEEIARLAYSYWEARGYQGGSPEEDWRRAEEELARPPIEAPAPKPVPLSISARPGLAKRSSAGSA